MIGTFAISGSVAIRLRNRVIAAAPSIRSASMFTSIRFAPFSHLLARDVDRRLEVAGLDQAARTASSR